LLPAIVIAAVSNLDNLGVAVTIGIRGTRIAAIPNLIIAAVTMAGTAAAMSSGRALAKLVPSPTTASLGALIIIAVGAETVLASLGAVRAPERSPVLARALRGRRRDSSDRISYREALVLGVALSLNNVASGIGAGVAGIRPLATTLLAGAFSLLSIGGGSFAGQVAGRLLSGRRAPLVSGLALLAIGIAMLSGARKQELRYTRRRRTVGGSWR
jgi:putative Mn2+ efflux pump MntP